MGLEYNIWYDKRREKLARNADLLQRIHALAEINGRDIMSPSYIRKNTNKPMRILQMFLRQLNRLWVFL